MGLIVLLCSFFVLMICGAAGEEQKPLVRIRQQDVQVAVGKPKI